MDLESNNQNTHMNTVKVIDIPENLPIALHIRTAAFALDAILALALSIGLLINFALPSFYPGEKEQLVYDVENYIQAVQVSQSEGTPTPVLEFTDGQKNMVSFFNQFIFAVLWLYFTLSEFLMQGESLGKKVFSIRVINTDTSEKPNLLQSMVRSFIKATGLLYLFPFLLINYIFAFFNKDKKAGHDFAVKTSVIG